MTGRQLLMTPLLGAPFDWTLAASDLARAWARGAMAAHQRGAHATPGPHAPQPPTDPLQHDFWPEDHLATPAWSAHRPDRKWSTAPRPMSIPARKLTRREQRARAARQQLADAELAVERPQTRADCVGGPRPCPFVGCRFHLYLDVSEQGWLKLNFPHLDVADMTQSCALDVADAAEDEGITLEALGLSLNISLEGARQVEADALEELRAKLGEYGDAVVAALVEGRGRG